MKKFRIKPKHAILAGLEGCQQPGNWELQKIVAPGDPILASDRNNEFLNVINNSNPAGLSSLSYDLTTFQDMIDPYPSSNPAIPSSLCEEIKEIRYQLHLITGEDQWYIPPVHNLKQESGVTGGDSHNHLGIGVDPINGGGALIGEEALEDNSISNNKLQDGSVNSDKIANNSINTDHVVNKAITDEKLADDLQHARTLDYHFDDIYVHLENRNGVYAVNVPPTTAGGDPLFQIGLTTKKPYTILLFECEVNYQLNSAGQVLCLALFEDGNLLTATGIGGEDLVSQIHLSFKRQHSTVVSPIYTVRSGVTFGSYSINHNYGYMQTSALKITEISSFL